MNTENKTDKPLEFGVEVIAKGEFVDNYDGFERPCKIETKVVRLNDVAYYEFLELNSESHHTRRRQILEQRWNEFYHKVASAVDFPDYGVTVTQTVSEIFTIVYMYKI